MPRRTDARANAIRAALRLFDRQGFHGTGVAQVVAESGAPRGSFYFHFPQGKEQLAGEVIAVYRRQVSAILVASARSGAPDAMVAGAVRALGRWLKDSGYVEGCAVVNIALDVAADNEALRLACRGAFREWRGLLVEAFTAAGIPARQAGDLAWACVAGLEGAVVLSRVERSPSPLQATGRALVAQVRDAQARALPVAAAS